MINPLPSANESFVQNQNKPHDQVNQVRNILHPHPHDVLCGRGITVNKHVGNKMWRELIRDNMADYCRLPRSQRQQLTHSIVMAVRSLSPPGRFLMLDKKTRTFYEIGDAKANLKTAQAMRDTKKRMPKQSQVSAGNSFDSDDSPTKAPLQAPQADWMRSDCSPLSAERVFPASRPLDSAFPVAKCYPPCIPKPMPSLKRLRSDDTFDLRIQNLTLVLSDDVETISSIEGGVDSGLVVDPFSIPSSIQFHPTDDSDASESSIDFSFEEWPGDVDVLDLY